MKLTFNLDELADVLGIERKTLLNRRSTAPETLPPPLALDWKNPIWLIEDVHTWLRSRSVMQKEKS